MKGLKITIRQVPDENCLNITTGGATPTADAPVVCVCRNGGVWTYALGEETAVFDGYSSQWSDAFAVGTSFPLNIVLVDPKKLSDLLSFLKGRFPEADLAHVEEDQISLP